MSATTIVNPFPPSALAPPGATRPIGRSCCNSAWWAFRSRPILPFARGRPRITQTDRQQIDLLADVFGVGKSPVQSGYFSGPGKMNVQAVAAALAANFEKIRVGVHDRVQVVLGYNWDGAVEATAARIISQVFTSTVAGGGYGGETSLGKQFRPVCRLLLRAAYLGTLLAAVGLGRTPVVLTLIGGGVFGNPIEVIWESILWAFDQIKSHRVEVVLNGYNLSQQISLDRLLPDVQARGGAILQFDTRGLTGTKR